MTVPSKSINLFQWYSASSFGVFSTCRVGMNDVFPSPKESTSRQLVRQNLPSVIDNVQTFRRLVPMGDTQAPCDRFDTSPGCQRNPPTKECDWNRRKPYFNIRVPFWLPSSDRSLAQILLSWSIDGSCRNRMDSLSSFVLSPLQLVTMSETVSMEATATAEGQ